jgi:hypothetical protein
MTGEQAVGQTDGKHDFQHGVAAGVPCWTGLQRSPHFLS